jgi:colanic acid/amylovoran biosynthesis protein
MNPCQLAVPKGIIDLNTTCPDDGKCNEKPEASDRCLTVGLLGASFGTKNLGVAALTCGTVASVFHSFPNARLFLVDYGIEPATYEIMHPGGVATVELVNIRFSKRFYLRNNIAYLLFISFLLHLLPSCKWRAWIQRHNHVLKAIHEADVIGSIAGGDSFSDIYGLRRLIYVALPQVLVQILGKPLVLLPQTLGPFKGTFARAVARSIIKRSKMVYTRDPDGVEAIRGLTGLDTERLAFAFDMGFALEPHIKTERIPDWIARYDRSIPLVGLNVSGLLYNGGYTRCNTFGIRVDYRRLIHDLIDLLVRKNGIHVMLVPHVFGTREDSESDVIACRKVYYNIGDRLREALHLVEEEYDQHEIKALIGRCDFFIGSRMHACIAAISQCVPTVGLAYSRKFHGVFQSVGMEELVIDIRELDGNSIIAAVDRDYQLRSELREKLEAKIPAVRASVLGLFRLLSPGNVLSI